MIATPIIDNLYRKTIYEVKSKPDKKRVYPLGLLALRLAKPEDTPPVCRDFFRYVPFPSFEKLFI